MSSDVDGLLAAARDHSPDVAIVDIRMPPTFTNEGLLAATQLRATQPGVGVLVLSQYVETQHAWQLLGDDARGVGYLLKDRVSDLGEFTSAIRRVGRGGSAIDPLVVARLIDRQRVRNPLDVLSKREREVLGLMAEGRANRAIAERLTVDQRTVETHVRSIFNKLELPATAEDHRRVLAVLSYPRRRCGRRAQIKC